MDQQTLMQMLMAAQSGGGLDSSSMMQQLVASSDDPAARMLASMMAQRQADAARAEEEEDEEEDDELQEQLDGALARLAQTQETLRRVHEHLEHMRDRNELLASALGACARCWGGDPRCAVCSGKGRSGSVAPNPALFAKFVLPALRKMAALHRQDPSRFFDPMTQRANKES
jgi:NAD(P)H-dependent FMN reductase